MIEFIIKTDTDKEYKCTLRYPLFNDYRFASLELTKVSGAIDKLAAGSALIQHCWESGDEIIKNGDESKNAEVSRAYTSLCVDVYNELYTGYEIEVKKK